MPNDDALRGGLRLEPRSPYLSLALTSLQRAIAYRGTTFMNLLSGVVWLVALYYLWRTVFAGQAQFAGYTWDEMRTYIVVAYAVSALLSFYSLMRIINTIRTGEIATDLMRPIDFLLMQLAQTSGAAIVEGLLSSAIALVLGVALIGIALPQSVVAFLLFLVSVILGFLIKFLISFLVALLCFRTVNAIGLVWTQTAIINLLSGELIPLQFFPDFLRSIVLVMPFGGIVYTPAAIYLGKLEGLALVQAVGLQCVWVVVLWGLARLFWMPSLRALEIQGG